MTHIVMMKFEEGFFSPAVTAQIGEAFAALAKALPDEIREVQIEENCVQRPVNMDLFIRMELAGEQSLPVYLDHPIHRKISGTINPHIVSRCSFDYGK